MLILLRSSVSFGAFFRPYLLIFGALLRCWAALVSRLVLSCLFGILLSFALLLFLFRTVAGNTLTLVLAFMPAFAFHPVRNNRAEAPGLRAVRYRQGLRSPMRTDVGVVVGHIVARVGCSRLDVGPCMARSFVFSCCTCSCDSILCTPVDCNDTIAPENKRSIIREVS